jgi:cysteine desulfurase/selenocysteine lyase
VAAAGQAWLRAREIIVSGLEHHANLVPAARRARQRRRAAGAAARRPGPPAHPTCAPAGPAHAGVCRAGANATGERPTPRCCHGAQAGALTVLDAAQAVSHAVPVLAALDCDFMAFSGHKMYGPMGTGVLAGRARRAEISYPLRRRRHGGVGQLRQRRYAELPARLEGGTPNVAGAVGLAAAAARFIDQVGRAAIDRTCTPCARRRWPAWRPSTASPCWRRTPRGAALCPSSR